MSQNPKTPEQLLQELLDQMKSLNRNFTYESKMSRQSGKGGSYNYLDRDYDDALVNRMRREIRMDELSYKIYKEREKELKREKAYTRNLVDQAKRTGQYNNDVFRTLESFNTMFEESRRTFSTRFKSAIEKGVFDNKDLAEIKAQKAALTNAVAKFKTDAAVATQDMLDVFQSLSSDIQSQIGQINLPQTEAEFNDAIKRMTDALNDAQTKREQLYSVDASLRKPVAALFTQFNNLADSLELTTAMAHRFGDIFGPESLSKKDQEKQFNALMGIQTLLQETKNQQDRLSGNLDNNVVADVSDTLSKIADEAETQIDVLRDILKKQMSKQEMDKLFTSFIESLKEGKIKEASADVSDLVQRTITKFSPELTAAVTGASQLLSMSKNLIYEVSNDQLAVMRQGIDLSVLRKNDRLSSAAPFVSNMVWAERLGLPNGPEMAEWRNKNRLLNLKIGGGNEADALNAYEGMVSVIGNSQKYKDVEIAKLLGGTSTERLATANSFAKLYSMMGKQFSAENLGKEFDAGGLGRAAYIQGITPQEMAEAVTSIAQMPEIQSQFLQMSNDQIQSFNSNTIQLMNVGKSLGMTNEAVQGLTHQMIERQKKPMLERLKQSAMVGILGQVMGLDAQTTSFLQKMLFSPNIQAQQKLLSENKDISANFFAKATQFQMENSTGLMVTQQTLLNEVLQSLMSLPHYEKNLSAVGQEAVDNINNFALDAKTHYKTAYGSLFIDQMQNARKTDFGTVNFGLQAAKDIGQALENSGFAANAVNLYTNTVKYMGVGDARTNANLVEQSFSDLLQIRDRVKFMQPSDVQQFTKSNRQGAYIPFLGSMINATEAPSMIKEDMLNAIKLNLEEVHKKWGITESNPHITNKKELVGPIDNLEVHLLNDQTSKAMGDLNDTIGMLNDTMLKLQQNNQLPLLKHHQKQYPGTGIPGNSFGLGING